MKKILLSCTLVLMATAVNAQTNDFIWKYNDATKTATLVSKEHWHKHGNEDVNGDCHCYTGNVVVPEKAPNGYTVTGIGKRCFENCNITSIKLPGTIKVIDELAFELCEKLKEISIPASVDYLAMACFGGTGLERVIIEDGDNPIKISSNGYNCGSVFMSMNEVLQYVYIGRNFNVEKWEGDDFRRTLFYGCEQIKEIEFGTKVNKINPFEFANCHALKKVVLSPNITVIPTNCFDSCTSLEELSASSDLTTIGDYAFEYCCSLKLNLSTFSKLRSIGQGALMQEVWSTQLQATKVVLPPSVDFIGDTAFGWWPNLKEFHSLATVPPTCESSGGPLDEEGYKNCKLFVPNGSLKAYKAAEGWKNFFNIEEQGETKCATPTVRMENGKLKFECATKGVEFHYDVNASASKKGDGNEVEILMKYIVSVYATKDGLENSDVTNAEFTAGAGSSSGLQGDINGDNAVNAADVVTLVNIIMGRQ